MHNRSRPPGTMVPALIYDDVSEASAWLCRVFGFSERLRAADADGRVVHAQLAMGQGGVFLGASGGPELRPPRSGEVSQIVIVHIDDADSHHARARASGARILQPPTTQAFGERQYTAEDLAGHRWTFSQSVADVPPEDWGATVSPPPL